MGKRIGELAPCGIFCGACPSFGKSCKGCAVEDAQQRKSKWNCKIRRCCYDDQQLDYCAHCDQAPCTKVNKKLTRSHEGVARYAYRHEIPAQQSLHRAQGTPAFIQGQKTRWTCPHCGERVVFYHYTCEACGKIVTIE